jgi:hypothetical protein
LKTLNLREAAAFLHMHAEEVRTRAKRRVIPGAKIGRRWIFIDEDLAEFVRSQYPVTRQALPVRAAILGSPDPLARSVSSSRTIDEYNKLLGLTTKSGSRSPSAR